MTNFDDSIFDDSGDDALLNAKRKEVPSTNSSLDDALKAALTNDNMRNIFTNGIAVPPGVETFSVVSQLFSMSMESNDSKILLRALVSYLDEITEGEISRRFIIYNLERQIAGTMVVMKYANIMYEKLSTITEPTEAAAKFTHYMQVYGDILNYCIQDLLDEYKNKCELLDVQPNQGTLDKQIFDFADLAIAKTVGASLYERHYQFGDMLQFTESSMLTLGRVSELLAAALQSDRSVNIELDHV